MAKRKRAPRPPVDETFDALVIGMEDAERCLVRRLDTGAEIWFVTLEGPDLVLGRRVQLHASDRAHDPDDEEETWIGETLASTVDPTLWKRPPLALRPRGTWDPKTDLVREDDDAPLTPDEQALVDAGPRPQFEMEVVLPGGSHENPYEGPYYEALDRLDAGEWEAGEDQLWRLVERDPRCILANNELGTLLFDEDGSPETAARALPCTKSRSRPASRPCPLGSTALLPWGHLDNRPFLRALHGYGLCLWRLERFDEARAVFRRMLRLNPDDNQGVRFLVESVEAREEWEPEGGRGRSRRLRRRGRRRGRPAPGGVRSHPPRRGLVRLPRVATSRGAAVAAPRHARPALALPRPVRRPPSPRSRRALGPAAPARASRSQRALLVRQREEVQAVPPRPRRVSRGTRRPYVVGRGPSSGPPPSGRPAASASRSRRQGGRRPRIASTSSADAMPASAPARTSPGKCWPA